MAKKKVVIKKIKLDTFIQMLNEIYMSGADYIDLYGRSDANNDFQDEITISVPDDYMANEYKTPSPPEGIEEEDNDDTPLTSEDLNNLLDYGL